MANPSQIWVIGSINTDLVVNSGKLPGPGETVKGESFFVNPGGKGANQAVAAARLGATVSMVGCVGADDFGSQALAGLAAENIDCAHTARDSEPTGVTDQCRQSGLNQITVAPGANNYLDTEIIDQAFQVIPSHATLLLQLEIPIDSVEHAVKLGRTKNCRLILDPAPAQRLSTTIFKNISLITPNTSEAAALTGFSVTDFGQARRRVSLRTGLRTNNIDTRRGRSFGSNQRRLHPDRSSTSRNPRHDRCRRLLQRRPRHGSCDRR